MTLKKSSLVVISLASLIIWIIESIKDFICIKFAWVKSYTAKCSCTGVKIGLGISIDIPSYIFAIKLYLGLLNTESIGLSTIFT